VVALVPRAGGPMRLPNRPIEADLAVGDRVVLDPGMPCGQCYPCNALINDVWAENNGLGYSGTNSGGNLTIVNSQFNNNRSGIDPNSGSYELCYPERDSRVIGNVVFANSDPTTPSKGLADLAFGTGITVGGGSLNTVERNYVYDHDRVGIAVAPFPEENPHDLVPERDEWDLECDEQRELPLTEPTEADLAAGTFLVWEPYDNSVRDNVVENSRLADLIVSGFAVPTEELGNCFSGNTFATSQPADIETLAPCDGEGSGDWTIDPFDPVQIVTFEPPPSVDYETAELPPLSLLPGMDDPENAPANPAVNMPPAFDTDSIALPTAPYYTHDG
jgi:hypothetical protein